MSRRSRAWRSIWGNLGILGEILVYESRKRLGSAALSGMTPIDGLMHLQRGIQTNKPGCKGTMSSSTSTEPAEPWSEDTAQQFEGSVSMPPLQHLVSLISAYSKAYSKHFDPCQEAANKSIKCLHRNPTQKDLCNDYFQCVNVVPARKACRRSIANKTRHCRAYRDCKKLWVGG